MSLGSGIGWNLWGFLPHFLPQGAKPSQVASCGVTGLAALLSLLQGRHLASVFVGLVLEDQTDRLL
jgi:hypothetical protein